MFGQLVVRAYTESDIRRFYTYVSISKPDECWEWVGPSINDRAIFNFDHHQMIAARFCWWFTTGIWPGEWGVLHSCDNPMCCNPKHLALGTQKDNMQDCVKRGRVARRGSPKLTEDEVRTIRIRRANGISAQQLADEYGVGANCIREIVRRHSWKYVD